MLGDSLKNRLKSAVNELENKESNSIEFNFNDISGDSKVRKIPITSIVPAPAEWNFYRPLSDNKMTELIDSILSKGLLNPIVVWEQEDGIYMNLAGHNRLKAYEYIFSATGDAKYEYIDAHIKGKNEINEIEAREIIIDTNWVQRELSPIERSRSIVEKYTVLQRKSGTSYGKHGEGKIRDIIAEQYGLSGRQIDNYRRLSNLIPEIQDMVSNGEISHSPASDIAVLDHDTQMWIYENFKDKITSRYTRNISSYMDRESIKKVFLSTPVKKDNYIKLPLGNELMAKYNNCSEEMKTRLEIDFQIFFEEWIKNKRH